jgi:hypothetical protein
LSIVWIPLSYGHGVSERNDPLAVVVGVLYDAATAQMAYAVSAASTPSEPGFALPPGRDRLTRPSSDGQRTHRTASHTRARSPNWGPLGRAAPLTTGGCWHHSAESP